MIITNIDEAKNNIFSQKLLFSNELIEKAFNKNFNNTNSDGNISKYHFENVPVIILNISKNDNNILNYKNFLENSNILPYNIYLFNNISDKKNSILEDEKKYNNINSKVIEINYVLTNVFNTFNNIIILKRGRFKDYNYILNILFTYYNNSNIVTENIHNQKDYLKDIGSKYFKNDIYKINKLLKNIKK
jgi:hypothetical protein